LGRTKVIRLSALTLLAVVGEVAVLGGCAMVSPAPPEAAAPREAQEPAISPDMLARFTRAERRLDSGDAEVRRQSAIILLSIQHPRGVRAILHHLRDSEDPAVRISMIEAVGFCREHRCFSALVEALKDPVEDVKKAAAEALANFGRPDEVQAMIELVRAKSTTDTERVLLLESLGRGLSFGAVPVLIEVLGQKEREVSEQVRVAAWEALKQISGLDMPPDAGAWRQWWDINWFRTREDVLEERIHDLSVQIKALNRTLEQTRAELEELFVLARARQTGQPKLLLNGLRSDHERIRRYAAFSLSRLSDEEWDMIPLDDQETYESLRDALDDESVEMRQDVARLVVQLKGTYRNRLILKALQDEDAGVLVRAIEGLSRETGVEALERLKELLAAHRDAQVREAVANALGKLALKDATGVLIEALDDEAENVRWFAVESLHKLGAVQAVPRLCELVLRDDSARVRDIAATALGGLGQPSAVPALKKALADENERVRSKAAAALQALADEDYERMTIIAEHLAKHGFLDAARDVLRRTLEKFGDQQDLQGQLLDTRSRLAQVLMQQKDFVAAASLYLELDELTEGDPQIRERLMDCWLAAGQADKLLGLLPRWLEGADEQKFRHAVTLSCRVAEKLIEQQKKEDARKILELLSKFVREAADEELLDAIDRVRKKIEG